MRAIGIRILRAIVATSIVLGPSGRLYSQQQTQGGFTPLVIAAAKDFYTQPNLKERLRRRNLSANEKALEEFYRHNLPLGWTFESQNKTLILKRTAPTYLLSIPTDEYRNLSKNAVLTLAKTKGTKQECKIEFLIERHDDIALVRQKVRLFKEIRADIAKAYNRLNLKHLCRDSTPVECSLTAGPGRDAALEYLTTRTILSEKLEVTPLYRIGTLYLYPQKNQCVLPAWDWYVTNTLFPETARLLPLEAGEEVELILRNMAQLTLWN